MRESHGVARWGADAIFLQGCEKRERKSSACNWGKSVFRAEGTANAKSLEVEGNKKEERGRKGKEVQGAFGSAM